MRVLRFVGKRVLGLESTGDRNFLANQVVAKGMRRRHLSLLGFVLATGLASNAAWADSVSATRYEIIERAHTVDMRVDRGVATLVVRRTVANSGPKSDQATFFLNVPALSVATRLRTLGANAKGEPVWFEGELMEAEEAARKYQELTGIGGYYPKDPALLSWRSQGLLALQVFPVPAQGKKTVEYTLKMPLAYSGGAYHAELPPLGTDELHATVRVAAAHAEDLLLVNGVRPRDGEPLAARADRPLEVELAPRGTVGIEGTLGAVPILGGDSLVRWRLAVAPHLAEAPRGAHVVVLFDGSRSHHDAAAGLSAVRAYLAHMPEATVDFLTFDRAVKSPLGASLPVATLLARLAAWNIDAKNGSRLDDALARADAILRGSAAAARRVLIITDGLTRRELTPEKFGAAKWQSGALVHMAVVEMGANATVTRDDDSPWATLPRRTGGLFWNASAPERLDAPSQVVFEEWARPKRIDKFVVRGLPADFSAPDALDEGEGLEHFVIAGSAPSRVEVTGEVWSKALRTSMLPSAEQAKLAAGLVFGTELFSSLSDAQEMKLAMLGGVVSPVTSYLAIEPGVRPSNEGLDWAEGGIGEGGGGMGSGIGLGAVGTLGHGAANFDTGAWLRGALASAARGCGLTTGTVSVSLETTLDEIVEVGLAQVGPTRNAKAEACVREELWEVALPPAFVAPNEEHQVMASL